MTPVDGPFAGGAATVYGPARRRRSAGDPLAPDEVRRGWSPLPLPSSALALGATVATSVTAETCVAVAGIRRGSDVPRRLHRPGRHLPGPCHGDAGLPRPGRRAGLGPRRPVALAPALGPVAYFLDRGARRAAHPGLRAGSPPGGLARGRDDRLQLPLDDRGHHRVRAHDGGGRGVHPGYTAPGAPGTLVGLPPVHVPGTGPGVSPT